MRQIRVLTLGVWAIAALGMSHAQAALVQWQIDTAQSSVKLEIPDQAVIFRGTALTLRMRNQNNTAWTTNIVPISGSVNTKYVDGVQIQFLNNPLGQLVGLNTGNYRPNPAAFRPNATNFENPEGQFGNTSFAPGSLGLRLSVTNASGVNFDFGYGNIFQMSFDVQSTPRLIDGTGQFGVSGETVFGVSQSTLAIDGLVGFSIGQGVPDSLAGWSTSSYNTALFGGVTSPDPVNQPLLRRLHLPVDVPTNFELAGIQMRATFTGTIVAYVMVPEPSSLLLAGSGAIGWAAFTARRRRGHRRETS